MQPTTRSKGAPNHPNHSVIPAKAGMTLWGEPDSVGS